MVKAGSYSVGLISPQSRKVKREETPHLPEEVVIEEILPRLPVKSLLKFKCVAKSWYSLIESKGFMKAHLENSIKSSKFAHHPIPFYTAMETDQFYLPSLFDMPITDRETFNADLGIDSNLRIELVGWSNGLVCLLIDEKRFILWNPATKKFNNLPDFPDKTEYSNIQLYGFGFDELNDDYKVFALVWDDNPADYSYSTVYSLRSNSWNVIEEPGYSFASVDYPGMYVNGKLHWYKCSLYVCEIFSFDLNSYVYGVIQLPIDPMGFCVRLGVVGGCLSALYFSSNSNMGLDVWLMKEYGVKESWDKVATAPYYNLPKRRVSPRPIAIDPNGDIFLRYGSDIKIYNTKSDELRHSTITSRDLFRDMCIYIESLASVGPDAEQERRGPNIFG